MKHRYTFGLVVFLVSNLFAMTSCKQTYEISKDELYDKLKGAWAGQVIGCTYGGPTEFRYCRTMIPDSVEIPWGKGEIQKWFDGGGGLYDDIYVDYTFIEALDRYGLDAPADSFATAFLSKAYPLCHSNQQSRYNLQHGISATESGFWRNNPHANCLDFQIESDFAGIVTPGMVQSGADLCNRVGHMLAYGDGWYGGVYVAAMYSLAYVSTDIESVVKRALEMIPAQSRFYECISDVIRWHEEEPGDWKICWRRIEDKWGSADIACPDGVENPFNIETYVTGAYIVLGLLYGEEDFEKTMDIATRAGQDSDCNPSSAVGILGTLIGYDHIPSVYTDELVKVENRPFNHSMSFHEGCQMSFKQALDGIVANGGTVTEDNVSINVQKIQPVRYEVSFEGLELNEKIPVENWIENFPVVEFEGVGAVIKGQLEGDESVPQDYVALLDVYFNERLIETCQLPFEYNRRKHELFFNYDQPVGTYKISCKWRNPVVGAKIWVRDVITYRQAEEKVDSFLSLQSENMIGNHPILPVTGSFMNLAYKDVRNKYTNPLGFDNNDPVLWETKVRELHDMGIEYLILMEVANDGKSFYPSEIMEPQFDPSKKSPVEAILDEAGKQGMKVFLSTGWAQNQDDDLRIPAIKERQLQIMDEIGALYENKKAFYGWYLPVEDCINPIFPKHAVDAVNVLVEKAHKLTPGKKTLISPYGLGLSDFDNPDYERTLAQLKVDIIAYQDEVGCVREATPLPELRKNWKRLREVHDNIGIEMWANCENFTWEKGTNDRNSALIPAAYQRFLSQQVAASVAGVDRIVSFMFQGIVENPDSQFKLGQPVGSNQFYHDYMAWLSGDEYWKLSEAAYAGLLSNEASPEMAQDTSFKALVDDVWAEEDERDSRWVHREKGYHEFIFDMGFITSLDKVMLRMLNYRLKGIGLPDKVYLYASDDSKIWNLVSIQEAPAFPNDRHDAWIDIILFNDLEVRARYYKVACSSTQNMYLDEICFSLASN